MAERSPGPLGTQPPGVNKDWIEIRWPGYRLRFDTRASRQGPTCPHRHSGALDQVGYVLLAWEIAKAKYAGPAIAKHTSEEFKTIVEGIKAALITALVIMLVGTLLGAGIGAIAGAGGGAGPGAMLGFRASLAVLNWLGLAFLGLFALALIQQGGALTSQLEQGIRVAWHSCGSIDQIDSAARHFGEAVGILFSLILQAILLYLLKNAGRGMARLKQSKLFRSCPRLETWLKENFLRLCWRYKIKTGIPVLTGGGLSRNRFSESLQFARALLRDMMQGDAPKFRTFRQLHEFLQSKGMRVAKKELYGPKDPSNPKGLRHDAAQVIYSNPSGTVVVKVKTRGYDWGGRPGGTMSVEITSGGSSWEAVLCKLTRDGKVIAKTLLGAEDVVVLQDGVYAITKGAKTKLQQGARLEDLSKGGFGSDLRRVVEFELIEGGRVRPRSQDEFANLGHIDFQNFDPTGAWDLLGL